MSRKDKKSKKNVATETTVATEQSAPIADVETLTATEQTGEKKETAQVTVVPTSIPDHVASRYATTPEGFTRKTDFKSGKMSDDSRACLIVACEAIARSGNRAFITNECSRVVQSVTGVDLSKRKIDRTPTTAPNFMRKGLDRISCDSNKDLGYVKSWAQPQQFYKDGKVYEHSGYFYCLPNVEYTRPTADELNWACRLLIREQ